MKQTEIGMIPDDWEVKKIGELGKLKAGMAYDFKKIKNGLYPCFGGNGIRAYIDSYLYEGIFPIIGRQGELCGNVSLADGRFYATEHAVVMKPNKEIDSIFLYYKLIEAKLNQYATGCAQPGLSVSNINKVSIFLPPTLAEQRKIAKALSDVDNVISTLEKLITKKKNLKQGTMQQLLTGKKRLPGFAKSNKFKQTEIGEIPEDWKVKNFEELFEMKAGGDVDKNHFSNSKSHIYKYKIFSNGLENEGIYGYTNLPKYKGNAITITGRGTVGVAMYRKDDFDAVIRLLVLNSKDLNISDNRFITEQINSYIKFPNESTGVPQLTVPQVKSLNVYLPSKPEQTAIANVLSSMDREIEALNIKLEKYRNLKTGMMQQLLTGKIRLI